MLYIVGIGPGHKDYILPKALEVLSSCDIIIGFKRALETINEIRVEKKVVTTLNDIIINANNNINKKIGVVASGDPTFYGITNYLAKKYNGNISVIPGISSFQYLTCKINKSWNNAYVGSLHGREDEFINKVITHKLSIWLTDTKNNALQLCKILNDNSIECNVYIGTNLSYDNEEIWIGTPKEYIKNHFIEENQKDCKSKELSVFIVENNEQI